ncbi:M48 family metallopeptidase [Pseudidiomarina aestuarii]|uniref:M48 family metallopeptidase n=1 Tax=Pseudidiomarina aestuarii TaxID=624146 RepID=UPI003A96E186
MTLIYQINRSRKRRSVSIKVKQGEVRVDAPWYVTDSRIHAVVEQKREWIEKHLTRQQQQLQALTPRRWQAGEEIRWLGEPLLLTVQKGSKGQCERHEQQLVVTVPQRVTQQSAYIEKQVKAWFKQQALQWLDAFFAQWSHAKLQPKSWALADFSSKWGHCSVKGELKFTWKLWLAPESIVRSVVLHELAHLREFNHSKAFWQQVAAIDPDYQESERWLKQHGSTTLAPNYLSY